jgi:hypothetical protein
VPTIKVATIESANATWTDERARMSVRVSAIRTRVGPGVEVVFVTHEHLRIFQVSDI